MNQILVLLQSQNVLLIVTGVSLLLAILAMIIAASAAGSARKLRRKYKAMMRTAEGKDIESLILQGHRQLDQLLAKVETQEARLSHQEAAMTTRALTPVITRYNAFGEPGNDLSFSVSILDENRSGVVISSIFGREESRSYAKPVIRGDSEYTLTPEEIKVIAEAGK